MYNTIWWSQPGVIVQYGFILYFFQAYEFCKFQIILLKLNLYRSISLTYTSGYHFQNYISNCFSRVSQVHIVMLSYGRITVTVLQMVFYLILMKSSTLEHTVGRKNHSNLKFSFQNKYNSFDSLPAQNYAIFLTGLFLLL